MYERTLWNARLYTVQDDGVEAMSTIKAEVEFRHDNDCVMSGCPGHVMTAEHQTTSDYFSIYVDGELVYGGDDNTTRALLKLIKEVDYV